MKYFTLQHERQVRSSTKEGLVAADGRASISTRLTRAALLWRRRDIYLAHLQCRAYRQVLQLPHTTTQFLRPRELQHVPGVDMSLHARVGHQLRLERGHTAAALRTQRLRPAVSRSSTAPCVASFVDGVADARIKVIGCGGGGGNAVNRMITAGLQVRGLAFLCCAVDEERSKQEHSSWRSSDCEGRSHCTSRLYLRLAPLMCSLPPHWLSHGPVTTRALSSGPSTPTPRRSFRAVHRTASRLASKSPAASVRSPPNLGGPRCAPAPNQPGAHTPPARPCRHWRQP